MNRKQKIILGTIILILLIAVGVLLFLYINANNEIETPIDENSKQNGNQYQNLTDISNSNTVTRVREADPETLARQTILSQSMIFVETISSYSNHTEFESIANAYPLAVDEIDNQIFSLIKQKKNQYNVAGEYYASNGKVITKNIKSLDLENGNAEVEIKLQRVLTENSEEKVEYMDFMFSLAREDGVWLIESFNDFDKI